MIVDCLEYKEFQLLFYNCFQFQSWPITVIKNMITGHICATVKFSGQIKACDDAITRSSKSPDSL